MKIKFRRNCINSTSAKILAFIILFSYTSVHAQTAEIDSLKKLLAVTEESSKRVNILENLSYAYLDSSPDTAMKYARDGLQLAKNINSRTGEAICTNAIGNVYFHIGDNAKALEMYLEYLKIKEALKDFRNISVAYYNIGGVYVEMADYPHALYYIFKAKAADEKAKDSSAILYDNYSLGSAYLRMAKYDSALRYIDESYRLAKLLNDQNLMGAILNTYGETYFSLNDFERASSYYKRSIPYSEAVDDKEVLTSNYYGLAKVFKQKSMLDSSAVYAQKALAIARAAPFFKQVLEISNFLTGIYSTAKQFDSAFYYQQLSIETKDSLFNIEELKKVQNLKFSEQQRQQAIETEKLQYRSRVKLFIVIFTAVLFLIIAILLWRNNKQKHKANIVLQNTLADLKSTQAQLIQAEKMASLGQVTAGVAHEIQNPLNFVNNFSEINKELVEELKAERLKPNAERNEKLEDEILNNIQNNEEKIYHHGKRADAIVKSMLQHSGKRSGEKTPTDINALCDEYLRLSYHGMRAKDKNFNAEIKTDFDETLSSGEAGIGKINIVSQDVGRVMLNLFNNAFYAVNEKKKLSSANGGYQPLAEVRTRRINDKAEIIVSDNGNGIPQNIVDKIFQPFFTTKPTGEGTGLGLSLSYDIIKAHGGEINVETKESEGTTFIVWLPV